jgi:O-antigen/teichoic acid export membrane protein
MLPTSIKIPARFGPAFDWSAKLPKKLGVNRAVFFTLLNRGWGLISGVVTIFLVVTYFSPETQGYYYTFGSLLMLQVLLEFGFGVVLVQFISHEWAHLSVDGHGHISGDSAAKLRLGSLVSLALKFYFILSIMFFLGLGFFGQWFLKPAHAGIDVYKPWWLLCVGVGFSVLTIPLRCLLEGSNHVHKSQRIALTTGIAAGMAGWVAILLGANLYALVVVSLVTAAVNLCLMTSQCRPFLRLFRWNFSGTAGGGISWRHEFWPQQWRIGISWLCSYCMFQSFVPIAFRLQGAEAAGKLGVTLQIYNAVNIVASSFLTSGGPRMGMLGAKRDYTGLRQLVRRTWLQCLGTTLLLSTLIVAALLVLQWFQMPQVKRFAPWPVTLAFLLVAVCQQLMNVETMAIRFQKKEPFVLNSLVGALLLLVCNLWLGKLFGLQGVGFGFAIIMLSFFLPWGHYIYVKQMPIIERNSIRMV